MSKNDVSIRNLTTSELINLLSEKNRELDADFELASRIVNNERSAVDYFIGDFSLPILNYVTAWVLFLKSGSDAADEIYGEYYMFIAAPFDPGNDNLPEWHKVSLYKGTKGAKLYTYVNRITVNYFIKRRKKYNSYKKNSLKLLEFVDYETLLMYDYAGEDDSEVRTEQQRIVREAFGRLSYADRAVLTCLCVHKEHWAEAFVKLRSYLNPAGPDGKWKEWTFEDKQAAIDREWTDKQKQDAMAGLKKRAVLHLTRMFYELIEQGHEQK